MLLGWANKGSLCYGVYIYFFVNGCVSLGDINRRKGVKWVCPQSREQMMCGITFKKTISNKYPPWQGWVETMASIYMYFPLLSQTISRYAHQLKDLCPQLDSFKRWVGSCLSRRKPAVHGAVFCLQRHGKVEGSSKGGWQKRTMKMPPRLERTIS